MKKISKLLFVAIFPMMLLINSNKAYASNVNFANLDYEYRYTIGAIMSDYAQCEAMNLPFLPTAISVFLSIPPFPFYGIGFIPALAAGGGVVLANYMITMAVTDFIRMDAKIVNTSDPDCTWSDCYDESKDHTLDPDNSPIFNELGMQSERFKEEKFIKPYDCKKIKFEDMVDGEAKYHVCVYEEGGDICSEIVFCSGAAQHLVRQGQVFAAMFGQSQEAANKQANKLDLLKIDGKAQNAYIETALGKRSCGTDPWTGENRDDASPYVKNGNRCECTCCNNSGFSDGYEEVCCPSGALDTSNCISRSDLACDTSNERYKYHCVKKAFMQEEVLPPVSMPTTMSAYCSAGNDMGYTPFSFSGRIMRCLEGSIKNIFYGYKDVVSYDSNGNPERNDDGSYEFYKACQDGSAIPESNFCDTSFLVKALGFLEGFVATVLSLYITFIGVTVLTGSGFGKKELFIAIIKVSTIVYFCFGDGWKHGYYEALMTGSYDVASEFFDVIEDKEFDSEVAFADVNQTRVYNGQVVGCLVMSGESEVDTIDQKLKNCDFFDGFQYSGNAYPSGEKHFAVWDSLDCRFANYLGFSSSNNVFPTVAATAFAAIFTSASGLMFFIVALVMIFASIVIFARALFIGIVAMLFIALLIFISPLTIVCFLFKPTKPIFDQWFKQLLGYSIQPMVLFAFLALMMKILDIFFQQYMSGVITLQSTSVTHLGLQWPKISVDGLERYVGDLLRFTFIILVLYKIFEKVDEIMRGLTGIEHMSSGMPNTDRYLRKGLGKGYQVGKNIGGNAYNAGKAAAGNAYKAGGAAAGKTAAAASSMFKNNNSNKKE